MQSRRGPGETFCLPLKISGGEGRGRKRSPLDNGGSAGRARSWLTAPSRRVIGCGGERKGGGVLMCGERIVT